MANQATTSNDVMTTRTIASRRRTIRQRKQSFLGCLFVWMMSMMVSFVVIIPITTTTAKVVTPKGSKTTTVITSTNDQSEKLVQRFLPRKGSTSNTMESNSNNDQSEQLVEQLSPLSTNIENNSNNDQSEQPVEQLLPLSTNIEDKETSFSMNYYGNRNNDQSEQIVQQSLPLSDNNEDEKPIFSMSYNGNNGYNRQQQSDNIFLGRKKDYRRSSVNKKKKKKKRKDKKMHRPTGPTSAPTCFECDDVEMIAKEEQQTVNNETITNSIVSSENVRIPFIPKPKNSKISTNEKNDDNIEEYQIRTLSIIYFTIGLLLCLFILLLLIRQFQLCFVGRGCCCKSYNLLSCSSCRWCNLLHYQLPLSRKSDSTKGTQQKLEKTQQQEQQEQYSNSTGFLIASQNISTITGKINFINSRSKIFPCTKVDTDEVSTTTEHEEEKDEDGTADNGDTIRQSQLNACFNSESPLIQKVIIDGDSLVLPSSLSVAVTTIMNTANSNESNHVTTVIESQDDDDDHYANKGKIGENIEENKEDNCTHLLPEQIYNGDTNQKTLPLHDDCNDKETQLRGERDNENLNIDTANSSSLIRTNTISKVATIEEKGTEERDDQQECNEAKISFVSTGEGTVVVGDNDETNDSKSVENEEDMTQSISTTNIPSIIN